KVFAVNETVIGCASVSVNNSLWRVRVMAMLLGRWKGACAGPPDRGVSVGCQEGQPAEPELNRTLLVPGGFERGLVVDELPELGELAVHDPVPVDGVPLMQLSVALGALRGEDDALFVVGDHALDLFAEASVDGLHRGSERGDERLLRMRSAEQTVAGDTER